MKIVILIVISIVATNASPLSPQPILSAFKDINGRIIGGVKAVDGQFPWQVGLFVDTWNGGLFCGGSLISKEWVLTAGHCVPELVSAKVQLGSITLGDLDDNRVVINAVEYYQHENYTDVMFGLANDIALIKLPEPVELNDLIQTIALADEVTGPHVKITVSGWGIRKNDQPTVSNYLYYTNLTTITDEQCQEFYPDLKVDGYMCAHGNTIESTCSGDSGGPVVVYTENGPVQVGIVSFGSSESCEHGLPVGFTRVQYYRNWIKDKTGL